MAGIVWLRQVIYAAERGGDNRPARLAMGPWLQRDQEALPSLPLYIGKDLMVYHSYKSCPLEPCRKFVSIVSSVIELVKRLCQVEVIPPLGLNFVWGHDIYVLRESQVAVEVRLGDVKPQLGIMPLWVLTSPKRTSRSARCRRWSRE